MKLWSKLYRHSHHYPLLTSLWITTTSTSLFSCSTYNNNYSIRYSNIFRTTSTSVVSAFTVTTTPLSVTIQSQQQQFQLNHFVSSSTSLLQSRSISSFNHISDSIKGTNIGTTTALLLSSKINNQRNFLRNNNNIRMFSTTTSNSNDNNMNKDTIDDTTTTTTTTTAETNQSSSSPLLRVAICQFHVTEDKEVNIQTCSNYIDRAIQQQHDQDQDIKSKIDLIVLPEIWNSPYATAAFAEYAEPIPNVEYDNNENDNTPTNISEIDSPSIYMLQQKAVQHNIYIVGGSIPEYDTTTQKLYNTCVVINPIGQIIAKHQKVHLFDINVPNGITFKESDTLSSGTQITSFTINNNKSVDNYNCTIGIGICYDIRFVEYALLLGQYCNILIYPGAFNLITGPAHWELLQRARAIDTQCYVITASPARYIPPATNNTNTDKPLKYPIYMAWGHSTIVSPWGDILATTDEKESIVYGTIDLAKITTIRQSIPIRNQKRNDIYQLTKT